MARIGAIASCFRWRCSHNAIVAIATVCSITVPASADEGGVSFWMPGFFGSLAATPQVPGLTVAGIYYHTSVSAGADVAFARQVSRGHLTVPFTANITGSLNADADLGLGTASYVFATPVLGAQASASLLIPFGRSSGSVDATLTGQLGQIPFTISGARNDTATGVGDVIPQFALRWNSGVNNFLAYVTGDIPVGTYDSTSLANLGIGHGAIDAGGGYTYFNPQTGHEFSGVLGFTYNFTNTATNYRNGVDMHFDWGASQLLTKQWQVGAVGYVYNQISCDSGSGDLVGCFESRVIGVGPQVGYMFPIGRTNQGYLNLKGYKEFDAASRPNGWNVWLTLVISPAAPEAPPAKPMLTKARAR